MFNNRKIQKENKRLSSIIEDLKDGFCIIKADGNFIYVNIAALELLGIREKENSLNFFNHFIKTPSDITYLVETVEKFGYVKDYEIELQIANNRCPVLLTMNQINDLSKKMIGYSVLLKDMTYLKKVQHQLLQAQKMESIGLLASGIAHEFNNILTGILPNAELIKLSTSNNDLNYKRAELIQKSATRASDIVKRLLNFAREDKVKATPSTDFSKTAMETFDIIRKLFDKNVEILVEFEKDLGFVKIDDAQLQQIIMNLALNAKDAISNFGKIRFSAKNATLSNTNRQEYKQLAEGPYIRLEIEDNGHGISKENLKHIFDPFFTTKKPGKGTGLGLSMVYGIIKSINGEIEVQSELNNGTTFVLWIPKAESITAAHEKDESLKKIGRNRSILVIDDETMILELAHDMLKSIGYKVYTASRAEEGLKIYSEKKSEIEVVFLDLIMPDVTGMTCYNELKMINPKLKIIIISGIGDEDKKRELKELGIVHYIEKPFSIHSIIHKLETLF
jgi:two-component system, cell cycle sensor histidine kinase and response regulator CckA